MSTDTQPVGMTSRVRLAQQPDIRTAAAVGAKFFDLPYNSAGFGRQRPLQDDQTIGGGYNNSTDQRAAGPGLVAVTGKMDQPSDIAAIGLILQAILGNPVSGANAAGVANADFQHTFASGGDTVPVYSAEVQRGPGLYDVAQGLYCKTAAFSFKAGDQGYAKMTTDWGGVDVAIGRGASIAGAPTPLIGTRFPAFVGVLNLAGTATGAVMDTTWTITNTYQEDRYLGSASLGGVGLQRRALQIQATVRYTGDAVRAFGEVNVAGLPNAVPAQLVLSLGPKAGLTLTANAVRAEPMDPEITGIGGMEVKFVARAEQTGGARMLDAVLLNQIAAYV